MNQSQYDFKNTGAAFCHYCGNEIEMGTTCVFVFGNYYHTGCERKEILGEDE